MKPFLRWYFAPFVSLLVTAACVGGFVAVGAATGWVAPKCSTLIDDDVEAKDDWCGAHAVPESVCVECQPLKYPARAAGAQETAELSALAARRAEWSENNRKCKLHERRIQFASAEVVARLELGVAAVQRAPIVETVTAPGEISWDAARVAKLSSRVGGVVVRVVKTLGDKVEAGDMVALIDAPEVSQAKAEWRQSRLQHDAKRQALAALQAGMGAGRDLLAAEAAATEARLRLLAAEQTLANLGLSVAAETTPEALRTLGLPPALAQGVGPYTATDGLLPVFAPFAGEVVARNAVVGEHADPGVPLFTIADTSRLRLTLQVRLEDALQVKVGQAVRFGSSAVGAVAGLSPMADAVTRTVAVRVDLPNADGRHRANTAGLGEIVVRQEPAAVVVPSTAVHWEGCCHIVFVRDAEFEAKHGTPLFHVRKVRLGARDVAAGLTEVLGVRPGEVVATAHSGVLRGELLKNNLGAGCACHDH